jgi:hypothetical protein
MTDIPEMYLTEAVRRLKQFHPKSDAVKTLAATLQELGWTPPIDEARMAKARKVAAAVARQLDHSVVSKTIIRGGKSIYATDAIEAAYDALGED